MYVLLPSSTTLMSNATIVALTMHPITATLMQDCHTGSPIDFDWLPPRPAKDHSVVNNDDMT